jgi:L-serine/L-threonine ammonia-lyase
MDPSSSLPVFHLNTPLLESTPLSSFLGCKVFLKMDCLQPSGSFKIRGIGHLAVKEVLLNKKNHLITSSGGNAGLAVAYM